MAQVKVTHEFSATADHIWSLIGNPADLSTWHPAIASSQVANKQRNCSLADGGDISEEILNHDDNARSYTYRIVQSPLPMRNYVSTLSVEPRRSGGSSVTWEAEFEPEGIEAEQLRAMLGGLYDAGLSALATKIQ